MGFKRPMSVNAGEVMSTMKIKADIKGKRASTAEDSDDSDENQTKKRTKKGALRKVVQIFNPVFVEASVESFPLLVQKLTGRSTREYSCRGDVEAIARAYCGMNNDGLSKTSLASIEDQSQDYTDSQNEDRKENKYFEQGQQETSCNDGSSAQRDKELLQQEFEVEGAFDLWKFELDPGRVEQPITAVAVASQFSSPAPSANSSMACFLNRCAKLACCYNNLSELDVWAGLASDNPLPDINTIPPLYK